ncbi:Glutamine-dependent NAD(+) synthetase [Gammaproteobacteria bacterium]
MKNNIYITAAQINTIVGDVKGNAKKIISASLYARDKQQADLVVFPETTLTGYPPEDLLLRSELYKHIKTALKQIQTKVKNIYIILGLPTKEQNKCFNTAILIYNGKIRARYHKQNLPNYGVFDDKRYFTAGTKSCTVNIKNIRIAITICADMWDIGPMRMAKKARAQLMIGINASPFDIRKYQRREQVLKSRAREGKMPIVYVNAIGGQDEVVFDGGSMVVNAQGKITQQAPFFTEDLMLINIATVPKLYPIKRRLPPVGNTEELVYQALVLGVRDYVEKNNFQGAIISVSGGIDSALALAIAVDALGRDRVETIYLPSRHSSSLSEQITKEEAKTLGVKLDVISIEPVFKAYLNNLPTEWNKLPKDSTEENIQARCRAIMLMAFSNKKNLLVLSTGNKSEMAVGYATLYGDMVGGFCVLKDVPKTLVYRLAEYRNKISPVIPQAAITRAPTAELAPHQKDSDSLPSYPILDEIIERYIELNQSIDKITAAGFDRTTVTKVVKMIKHSEYKRRQSPPGVKITINAFGRERRYPITSKFEG